jgi:hypothetical protein
LVAGSDMWRAISMQCAAFSLWKATASLGDTDRSRHVKKHICRKRPTSGFVPAVHD